MSHDPVDVLIARANAGETGAQDALFATAYEALRELAHRRLHEAGQAVGMDTTVLVHESYLKLAHSHRLRPESRREFFAYAARVMREVIVDALSRRRAGEPLTLDTRREDELPGGQDEVLKVHEALAALQAVEPRLAQVVEMRYFGGYTETEIGETLGLTERTVRRDWDKARLMLLALLR
jgi:RNA polymerase sigma factor (TIGR02999 family)